MNMIESLLAILPTVIVIVTGMVVLLLDACVPIWRKNKNLTVILSIVGLCVAAGFALRLMDVGGAKVVFSGAIIADTFTHSTSLILIITAALSILLGATYLENKRLHLGEYHALVLFSTSGGMLMAASNDLITLFVAIETLSVALYVLAGFNRVNEKSEESALKYFLLGAFAAGFLLYGIALMYGGSAGAVPGGGGTTNLAQLSTYYKGIFPNVMFMTGLALLIVGLAFKAGLVPFHMWTPDVYEGAPTSATAYMSAVAKIAAFAAILRVFNALFPISPFWLFAVQALAVLTMFGGNLIAIMQENVKRMLAYSSIAHAGYLMVAIAALSKSDSTNQAVGAITFYMLAYALMTLGSFGVLIWLSRDNREIQTLDDLRGLGKTAPAAAYMMSVFMLSLGGIPPTMGFLGKWMIFLAALKSGQAWLAVALALASILSIFYYLKIVWMMLFQEPNKETTHERAKSPAGVVITLAFATAASILFGLLPNLVSVLSNTTTMLGRH